MTQPVYDQREALYAARKAASPTVQEQAAIQLDRCAHCTGGCKMAGFDAYLCARKAWPENFAEAPRSQGEALIPGQETGWQPMETAPQQTPLLVGHRDYRGWFRIAIRNACGDWSYDDRPWPQQDRLDRLPTHWRPLPPPPATEQVKT